MLLFLGQSGSNPVVSHEHILTGGSLESRNCSVRTVKKDGTLPTGNSLYRALQKYIMTEQQLVDNGYPRPHPSGEPGKIHNFCMLVHFISDFYS